MSALDALRFEPILRRYIWGGRRLETVLGKPLPEGDDYAESWEIVDHGEDQSVVGCGPLKGTTLGRLVRSRGAELLGEHHPQKRFPLLFKFLDAQRTLSVQVHPDDQAAARLDPPDSGKTEAWVVLYAELGSLIYAGLKPGLDRTAIQNAIHRGATESCLHRFEPQVGDCVLLPAGAVHALGQGLVVAEIQQTSDSTFRLFDWNRLGADGKPRPLHVQQGLDAIDYQLGPISSQQPQPTDRSGVARLAACDKFVLDRWRLDQAETIGGDNRFHLIAVLRGALRVSNDPSGQPLLRGQTILLPAAIGEAELAPDGAVELLDMYLP